MEESPGQGGTSWRLPSNLRTMLMAQAAPWSYVVASLPPFPSVGLWRVGC